MLRTQPESALGQQCLQDGKHYTPETVPARNRDTDSRNRANPELHLTPTTFTHSPCPRRLTLTLGELTFGE
jgi:hypothetical protein